MLRRNFSNSSGGALEKSNFACGAPLRIDSAVLKLSRHRITMVPCLLPMYEGSPLTRYLFVSSVFEKRPFCSVRSPAATNTYRSRRNRAEPTPIAAESCSAVMGPSFNGVNRSSCIPASIANPASTANRRLFMVSG